MVQKSRSDHEKGGSSLYWYGADGAELTETDTSGSTTNSAADDYVYFNGVRTARRDSGVGDVYYYFNDQIGSVRAIAEVVSGQTTATLCLDTDYYPFGTQRSPIVSSCTTSQKFTGKDLDTESSLYNSGARYYPPFEGRFMSPDPDGFETSNLAYPQSLNQYAYVQNNPLRFIDPLGLDCVYLADDGSTTPDTGDGTGASIDHNSSEQECHSTPGGNWIDGTVGSLSSVVADPNSNWVSGFNTEGQKSSDCVGDGDCSLQAFGRFNSVDKKIYVNGDAPDPIELTPSQVAVLGGVAQRTYGFNRAITCGSSLIRPFLPLNPADVLDVADQATDVAKESVDAAQARIQNAKRIGPSRAARVAKLGKTAEQLAKAAQIIDGAGTALAIDEAHEAYEQNCKGKKE